MILFCSLFIGVRLTRQVCNEHPAGVLYAEIYDPFNAAEELAKAAGLPLQPKSLFDIVAGYLTVRYKEYYV